MGLITLNGALLEVGGSLANSVDCCCGCVDLNCIASATYVEGECCCYTFTAVLEGEGCEIESVEWDFGDGTTGTGNPITHCYYPPAIGMLEYDAIVRVRTTTGCVLSKKVSGDLPFCQCAVDQVVADFNYAQYDDDPCCFLFRDLSSTTCADVNSWLWNFGDGNTSNQQNPTHCYDGAGPWDVTLSVADAYGCQDSVVMEVVCEDLGEVTTCCNCLEGTMPDFVTVTISNWPTPAFGAGVAFCPTVDGDYTLARQPGTCSYSYVGCPADPNIGLTISGNIEVTVVDYCDRVPSLVVCAIFARFPCSQCLDVPGACNTLDCTLTSGTFSSTSNCLCFVPAENPLATIRVRAA